MLPIKLRKVLSNFEISDVEIKIKNFANIKLHYKDSDKIASWQMYVELVTRVLTQKLDDDYGDDKAALNSIYKIFDISRSILKEYGQKAKSFSLISIFVLNYIIRPFTTKWHKYFIINNDETINKEFRNELSNVRVNIIKYAKLLGNIAKIDDLIDIEEKNISETIKI